MQLYPIALQSSPAMRGAPFSERYHSRFSIDVVAERFLHLIEHLEQNIEAPPQWVCTSHYDLHFFDCDSERFVGLGETPHWTLAVQTRQKGFTVVTHAHLPWVSEAVRVEHPETTEEAAAIIANILEK